MGLTATFSSSSKWERRMVSVSLEEVLVLGLCERASSPVTKDLVMPVSENQVLTVSRMEALRPGEWRSG